MPNGRMGLMRAYLDQVVAGDLEGAAGYYTDDVVFHWAGTGPVAGDHAGKAAYLAALQKLQQIVDSTSVEEHDLLVSDGHAVVLGRGTYVRGEGSISTDRVVVYHFRGDKISEVWVVDVDQAGVDAFLS
jgi:ketosteroid isomerase-like protein